MEDLVFFFSSRRRHTRYWRDWSSDVCSSDLCSCSDSTRFWARSRSSSTSPNWIDVVGQALAQAGVSPTRSEERRVGEECRFRGSPDHLKKKSKTKTNTP